MADESVEDPKRQESGDPAKAATAAAQGHASTEEGTSGTLKEAAEKVEGKKKEAAPEPASLLPLEPEAPEAALGNLDFILDVPLQITVNLGSRKMMIKELLQLGQGSVVELEKMAGEPMDVLIGDRLIARGEVVVVNEKFGVRLTDIVSTVERINQLNR